MGLNRCGLLVASTPTLRPPNAGGAILGGTFWDLDNVLRWKTNKSIIVIGRRETYYSRRLASFALSNGAAWWTNIVSCIMETACPHRCKSTACLSKWTFIFGLQELENVLQEFPWKLFHFSVSVWVCLPNLSALIVYIHKFSVNSRMYRFVPFPVHFHCHRIWKYFSCRISALAVNILTLSKECI